MDVLEEGSNNQGEVVQSKAPKVMEETTKEEVKDLLGVPHMARHRR